jgi:hypothetical protein
LSSKGALLNATLSSGGDQSLLGGVINGESEFNYNPDLEFLLRSYNEPSIMTKFQLENHFEEIYKESNQESLVKETRISYSLSCDLHYRSSPYSPEETENLKLIGLSDSDLDFLEPYFELVGFNNLNDSNAILLYLSSDVNQSIYVPLDKQFTVSVSGTEYYEANVTLAYYPLDISSFVNQDDDAWKQIQRRFGESLFSESYDIVMLTTFQGSGNIIDDFDIEEEDLYHYYTVNIDLDYTDFFLFSNNRDIQRIDRLVMETNIFYTTNNDFSITWIVNSISQNLIVFSNDYTFILIINLTLIIPPLCIAIFMINFSYNLVRTENVHQIKVLKNKGATNSQIRFALILESFLTTALAFVFGPLISIPFLQLIAKTSAFLEFKNDLGIPDYGLDTSWDIILIVFAIGILIAIGINLPRIISLSRLSTEELVEEEKRQKQPFWRRIYLDVIIAIIAVIVFILFIIAFTVFSGETREMFLLIFGVATPILVVTAISMLIGRFFNPAINWLGNKLWSIKGGTFAVAFKNLAHRNKRTSRAVILLMITLTFGFVSAIVPTTIDHNIEERWGYMVGADISLMGAIQPTNTSNQLENYDSIVATSTVTKYSDFYLSLGYESRKTTALGISTESFLEAAIINERNCHFSDKLTTLLDSLSSNGNVLLQETTLEILGLSIGENFRINPSSAYYTIIGTFRIFPNLMEGEMLDEQANNEFFVVGSRETLHYMSQNDVPTVNPTNQIYINKREKSNLDDVISIIENNFQGQYAYYMTVEEGVENDLEIPSRIAIYAMLNSAFLSTMICTFISIVIYSTLILF